MRHLIAIALTLVAGACKKHEASKAATQSGSATKAVSNAFAGREDMLAIAGGRYSVSAPACTPGTLAQAPQGSGSMDATISSFSIDRRAVSCDELKSCEHAGACVAGPDVSYCANGGALASFTEAQQYCDWRKAKLPSYAQWQRAARGAEHKAFPWGDAWKQPDCGEGSGVATKPCRFETSGFTYEAGSNPYEWTSDADCGLDLHRKTQSLPVIVSLGAFRLDEIRTADPSSGAGEFRCARQEMELPK